MQLLRCPWCGRTLDVEKYRVTSGPDRHLRIACGAAECDFGSGLPVHLVDEDVYAARPELLIGIVDKFARMAWSHDMRRLFGLDDESVSRPELVCRMNFTDLRPTRFMVGLYETAVDAACGADAAQPNEAMRRPKVIASTATIRRAEKQLRARLRAPRRAVPAAGNRPGRVLLRRTRGAADELGTREYVGVMAPGSSHQTLMIRI